MSSAIDKEKPSDEGKELPPQYLRRFSKGPAGLREMYKSLDREQQSVNRDEPSNRRDISLPGFKEPTLGVSRSTLTMYD